MCVLLCVDCVLIRVVVLCHVVVCCMLCVVSCLSNQTTHSPVRPV